MEISAQEILKLQDLARKIRQEIILMINEASSGHPAGSLGFTDILTALYFCALKHNPQDPNWVERDRLILSHGHICPALYATLAYAGYFPKEELKTFRKLGSRLQGHPHRESLPGLETSSGPLGCGLSQGCGIALAGKMDQALWRVICLVSDGEHDEGNHWEAVMLASKYKLDNLIALIDRNNIQSGGTTEEILPLEPLKEKYQAFGWEVLEIDGHNFTEIINAFQKAQEIKGKPTAIIAKVTPGKGVSFMENNFLWHSKVPNKEEVAKALEELDGPR